MDLNGNHGKAAEIRATENITNAGDPPSRHMCAPAKTTATAEKINRDIDENAHLEWVLPSRKCAVTSHEYRQIAIAVMERTRSIRFLLAPSLAAGRLGCGWGETVGLIPVDYGDLFGWLE